MNAAMQTALNTFKFDNRFFLEGIATLDDDVARQRIAGEVNPILWMAGHLLNSR